MKIIRVAGALFFVSGLSSFAQGDEVSQAFIPISLKTTHAQDDTHGFLEDQQFTGLTRNWYSRERSTRSPLYRYYKADGIRLRTNSRDTWVQGTMLNYSSGFTQGEVGFSGEIAGFNTIALERGRAAVAGPNNRTLTDSDGNVLGQWSKLGIVNLKTRISSTTLTLGRQSMSTPVLADYNNRALPSSFEGVSVFSEEFNNLSLRAGSFDRVSPRNEQSLTRFKAKYASAAVESDRVNIIGINYQPLKNLKTSLYTSSLEDIWRQYYFGAVHDLGDNAVFGLSIAVNYYKTRDEGSAKLGKIDNDTYSLALTGTHQAHSVTLAFQQVLGNEYFDYINETGANYLANSLYSDFNGPQEKSTRITYALNMAPYGVPGLKLNAYSARGWGIDGTHYKGSGYNVRDLNGEHHYEYGVGASYVIQSGPLKNSNMRATYVVHRGTANQIDGSLDELRVVTTIPFNFF